MVAAKTSRPEFNAGLELAKCRYYHLVPKDRLSNVVYRMRLIKAATGNREMQHALWKACSQDILYFINVFGFTYNPKDTDEPTPCLPFITYHYQDEAILHILWCIRNGRDLAIPKSREMGASWMVLMVYLWLFIFYPLQAFLLVSRKEDLVDKTGDYDSLMPKIDFAVERLPRWMVPRIERNSLHMRNLENGSAIDGESTNGDVSRGGRKRSIFFDEYAAVPNGHEILTASRDSTRCRIWGSTHKGARTAFYDVVTKTKCDKMPLHWTLHPKKACGLYHDDNGKPRSPWYDEEVSRCAHPMEVAQELDMDVLASDYVFFPPQLLDRLRTETVQPATLTGDLDFDPESLHPLKFVARENGPLRLWIHLDGEGKPPASTYVAGADVAEGASSISADGASNSSIAIGDSATGRKVAEYTRSAFEPHKLAEVAVALARWFKGEDGTSAYLIWEANGPGQSFGLAVVESGFSFFYCRRNETSVSRQITDSPGWWSTPGTKRLLLGEYVKALTAGTFVNPSYESIDEARYYVYGQNGNVYHSRSEKSIDPTGARENHGDRVIADAVCWWGMKSRPRHEPEPEEKIPYGSLAWRRQEADRKKEGNEEDAVCGCTPSNDLGDI